MSKEMWLVSQFTLLGGFVWIGCILLMILNALARRTPPTTDTERDAP